MNALLGLTAHLIEIPDPGPGLITAGVFAMPESDGDLLVDPFERDYICDFALTIAIEDNVPIAKFARKHALDRTVLN
jgi:hypothetical protein